MYMIVHIHNAQNITKQAIEISIHQIIPNDFWDPSWWDPDTKLCVSFYLQ